MSEIFISYRRNDSSAYTGRIADYLRRCFGEEYIFRDYETLGIGVQFKQEIQNFILSSNVVLVVIGPDWVGVDPGTGKQRLDNPDDFVRLEVEYALEHEITLIPLLVGGAKMPDSSLLPETMRKMNEFNAHQLTERHWDADIRLLVQKLELETGLDSKKEVAPSPSHWLSVFQPLLDVVPDFFSLLREPKRFLRKRSFGRPKDLVNALLFFAIFIMIAYIYLYSSWKPEGSSFWRLVFLGIPLWLLLTVILSIPMWFSWWVFGARNHYLKTMVILLYQVSMGAMIAFTGASTMLISLLSHTKGAMQKAYNIMLDPNISEKYQSVSGIYEAAWANAGPLSFIFLGLGAGILITMPIWLFISWGAYRETFSRTRWVSFLAFSIYFFTLGFPLWFLSWIGQGT